MASEIVSRTTNPCPCGKGEREEIHCSDDWNRNWTDHVMLCDICRDEYVYDRTNIYPYSSDGGKERGWVLKIVLEAEKKQRETVLANARELYYDIWKNKLHGWKSKKELRELLCNGDKMAYPSYSTFLKNTKGMSRERINEYVDGFFSYDDLKRVFRVCGVSPDRERLGATEEEIERFK